MPWKNIQDQYDQGMSTRDICEHFKVSYKTLRKAKQLKLFVPRTRAISMKVRLVKHPRDYSEVRKHRTALENYRADCRFKFNLADYPDEFDFKLIESLGWYKPKNRGNNLTGVSRDHAVSVRYGFDNKIPAKHLAHPANCILMQHGRNSSKGKKNSITYAQLLKRIRAWDKIYSEVH